jgi:hypothetical protein
MPLTDILILSNAPGELTTWVYPVLRELAERSLEVRISIVLSPCSNSSGNEAAIAQSYPNVSRVLSADQFFPFLLFGKTPDWDWADNGVVIFLGGDQVFPVIIGKRLGYRTLIYAEWEARWLGWIDYFAVRNQKVAAAIPAKFQQKVTVVGDLMVDLPSAEISSPIDSHKIVFMPGSKPMKLRQGLPLCLGIADLLKQKYPSLEFAIALAPTLTPEALAKFAQPNPVADLVEGSTADLISHAEGGGILRTLAGTEVEIHTDFPARNLLKSAQICITTVGANTAELAALHVPMVILLPTNQLDAMRGWDGLLGILANLPVVGTGLAKAINRLMFSRLKLLAWPNIWAGEEIVPELLGHLTPTSVVSVLSPLLEHPEKLTKMRDRLRDVCGQPGASQKIVDLIINAIAMHNLPS